jgi:hypothetical protein
MGFGPGGVLALLWVGWVSWFLLTRRRDAALTVSAAGASAGLCVASGLSVVALGAELYGRVAAEDKADMASALVRQTWAPVAALLLCWGGLAVAWALSGRPESAMPLGPGVLAVTGTVSGLCAVTLFLLTWADVLAVAGRHLGAATSADLAAVLVSWGGVASIIAVGLCGAATVVRAMTS